MLTEHGLKIAPSTHYQRVTCPVSPAELADADAANTLVDLYRAHRGLSGVRKPWHAARRAGHPWGRDQVGRLMRRAGLDGIRRGRRTTITTRRDASAPRHPDLRDREWASPSRPDQWWVADFTYVGTLAGFVSVSFVTDVYSRRILGRRVSTAKTTPPGTAALEQPLFTRRRGNAAFTATGPVHHSDAGSQYASLAFTEALLEAGIAGSIGSVGDALDNALLESSIGLYKTELIDRRRSWTGRNEVERETAAWVHWFNTERPHSAIGYRPPVEFEDHHHRDTTTSADLAVA